MRKWIPWLIVIVAIIASIVQYSHLPARVPTHWGAHGQVTGTSPRLWAAVMLPFVITVIAIMIPLIPRIDPRGANYEKFSGTFQSIMITVMLLLLVLHAALLAQGAGYPVHIERWVPVGVGAMLIVLGNLLPRARPNWFVGVRTPWTLSSDRVWEKTHRLAGYVFVIAGAVVLVVGLLGIRVAPFLMGPIIGIAALLLVVYSYVEWRREGGVPRPSSN